jgi:hypothetical protein
VLNRSSRPGGGEGMVAGARWFSVSWPKPAQCCRCKMPGAEDLDNVSKRAKHADFGHFIPMHLVDAKPIRLPADHEARSRLFVTVVRYQDQSRFVGADAFQRDGPIRGYLRRRPYPQGRDRRREGYHKAIVLKTTFDRHDTLQTLGGNVALHLVVVALPSSKIKHYLAIKELI